MENDWPTVDGDLPIDADITVTAPLGIRVPRYLGYGGAVPLMETPIAASLAHILADDEPRP